MRRLSFSVSSITLSLPFLPHFHLHRIRASRELCRLSYECKDPPALLLISRTDRTRVSVFRQGNAVSQDRSLSGKTRSNCGDRTLVRLITLHYKCIKARIQLQARKRSEQAKSCKT